MPDNSLRVVVVVAKTPSEVERVLAGVPARARMAVIVYCADNSLAADRVHAPMQARDVKQHAAIEPSTIYIVPADKQVQVRDRELVVTPDAASANSFDVLLRSVADHYGAQSVGVILSGAGTSGIMGIKRIKEVGGITIAQANVAGANAESPRAAIASGSIDLVLGLDEIASRLASFAEAADRTDDRGGDTAVDTLRDILTLVRVRSGHDFSAYKRATLFRRVSRRMQVCQVQTIIEYHQYLREHPGELANLLRDFTISVTNFFRDPDSFDVLARTVIPELFAGKTAGDQVRVWVPGCATGEEAYSLAILLAEYAMKHSAPQTLQVFATDIDEESLADARHGRYPESIAADVGPTRIERFFTREDGYYQIAKELRELVLFSPHNVLRDPPFSRLDLISCRNLLIYLNREAQDRVLHMFHFGLKVDGYLFLGSSESADNTSLFTASDAKARIFQRRTSTVSTGLDSLVTTGRWHAPTPLTVTAAASRQRASSFAELHFRIVEQYAPPSVLVNADLEIVHVSEHAGRFLEIAGGEPTKQLLRLVIPPLRLDLRTAIHAARYLGRGVDSRVVKFEDKDGASRTVEIRAVAHQLEELAPGSVLVLFDETQPGDAQAPVAGSIDTRAMEPVMREMKDELLSTRDQLRTTIEQYETSLEELKASNEELQAINEELRSATEELETSKEELQSVNEELTTLNHELKVKVDEVSHANSDLQNLMSSTDIGVLFLDRQLCIKRFTARAQDLFNVIPTDIGRPLVHLTHQLDAPDLQEQAELVLQTLRTVEREVTSKNARRYLMRLLPYRSLDDRIEGVVVTFVDITDLHEAVEARRHSEAALRVSEERLRLALGGTPAIAIGISRAGRMTWGYAFGKQIGEADVDTLFATGHVERFASSVRTVLDSKRAQRVELDVVVADTVRAYDFRFEPTEDGVDAIGVELAPDK